MENLKIYDATQYGLVAETSTEEQARANSNALQALINRASAAKGGTIYIPEGNYYFVSTADVEGGNGHCCVQMKSDVNIKGDGQRTVLWPMGATKYGVDMFHFNEYVNSGFTKETYLENCTFEDFVINGEEATIDIANGGVHSSGGKGFMFNLFKNCHWYRVTVKNTLGTGIGVDCPIDSSIVDCAAIGCGKGSATGGAAVSGFTIGFGFSKDENIFISRCRATQNTGYGFNFEYQGRYNPVRYSADKTKGFIVSNCTADYNRYNFGSERAWDILYRNCFSRFAKEYGYFFKDATDCSVIGCYSTEETQASFVIEGADSTVATKDIVFGQCVSKYVPYGAKIAGNGGTMQRNMVKDCYFDAEITGIITTSGNMESLILEGNVATIAGNNIPVNNFNATITGDFVNRYNSWNA